MRSEEYALAIKAFREHCSSLKQGDIVKYRMESSGIWERQVTAMVNYVDDKRCVIRLTNMRGEQLTMDDGYAVKHELELVSRNPVNNDYVYYDKLTESELEGLSNETKDAIRRRKDTERRKKAKREESEYKTDRGIKNKYRSRTLNNADE